MIFLKKEAGIFKSFGIGHAWICVSVKTAGDPLNEGKEWHNVIVGPCDQEKLVSILRLLVHWPMMMAHTVDSMALYVWMHFSMVSYPFVHSKYKTWY